MLNTDGSRFSVQYSWLQGSTPHYSGSPNIPWLLTPDFRACLLPSHMWDSVSVFIFQGLCPNITCLFTHWGDYSGTIFGFICSSSPLPRCYTLWLPFLSSIGDITKCDLLPSVAINNTFWALVASSVYQPREFWPQIQSRWMNTTSQASGTVVRSQGTGDFEGLVCCLLILFLYTGPQICLSQLGILWRSILVCVRGCDL
jgi:hypothetical protein